MTNQKIETPEQIKTRVDAANAADLQARLKPALEWHRGIVAAEAAKQAAADFERAQKIEAARAAKETAMKESAKARFMQAGGTEPGFLLAWPEIQKAILIKAAMSTEEIDKARVEAARVAIRSW